MSERERHLSFWDLQRISKGLECHIEELDHSEHDNETEVGALGVTKWVIDELKGMIEQDGHIRCVPESKK